KTIALHTRPQGITDSKMEGIIFKIYIIYLQSFLLPCNAPNGKFFVGRFFKIRPNDSAAIFRMCGATMVTLAKVFCNQFPVGPQLIPCSVCDFCCINPEWFQKWSIILHYFFKIGGVSRKRNKDQSFNHINVYWV